MRHIEEEYYKVTEQNATGTADSLIPPTPLRARVADAQQISEAPVNGSQTTLRRLPV